MNLWNVCGCSHVLHPVEGRGIGHVLDGKKVSISIESIGGSLIELDKNLRFSGNRQGGGGR